MNDKVLTKDEMFAKLDKMSDEFLATIEFNKQQIDNSAMLPELKRMAHYQNVERLEKQTRIVMQNTLDILDNYLLPENITKFNKEKITEIKKQKNEIELKIKEFDRIYRQSNIFDTNCGAIDTGNK